MYSYPIIALWIYQGWSKSAHKQQNYDIIHLKDESDYIL